MLKCLTVLPGGTRSLSRGWLEGVDYQLVRSLPEVVEYLRPSLDGGTPFGADWETDSLNAWQAQFVGLCLSVSQGTGRYFPVGHHIGQEKNLPLAEVIILLKALCEKATSLWAYYRYDGSVMRHQLGWEPPAWEDVTLGAYLQYSDARSFGLKPSALRLLNTELIEFDEVAPQGFHLVDPDEGAPYACQDADFTRRLRFEKRVVRAVKEQATIWKIEHRIIPPIMDGIEAGCWVDPGKLLHLRRQVGGVKKIKGQFQGEHTGMLKEVRDRIYAALGVDQSFNLDSRPQLGKKLVEVGVPIEERTDKGQIATGEEILQKYAGAHPVMPDLAKYIKLSVQDKNYLSKLLLAIAHFGPHLRFPFNTIGAPTGRMSAGGEGKAGEAYVKGYVDLNIQSLPDHEKAAYLPNIRSAFVANDPRVDDDEWVMVSVDYSQIELRIAASLSREPLWIDAFLNGVDIHARSAQMAYGNPNIGKDDPKRKSGKTMNFAILYQASAETAGEHGNISEAEAEQLIAEFLTKARRLSAWIDQTKVDVEALGYAKTHYGRRRYFKEHFAPGASQSMRNAGHREGINHKIQGTAADIFKIGTIRVYDLLKERGWVNDWIPWAWIHDELVSRVRRRKLMEMLPEVVARMEFPVAGWPVPIKADASVGWNWGELLDSTLFSSRYNLQDSKLVSWLSPGEVFALPADLAIPVKAPKKRKVA